jgi:plastocyanin
MHAIAVQLAPVIGAEKSKVPFYIAGGLLVLWALFVSLGVGARRSDFPAGLSQQRAVIAVTAVLVLAAVSTAVITSGGATSSSAAGASTSSTSAGSVTSSTAASGATSGAAPGGTQPQAALKLAANPGGQLAYDTKQLSAKAGSVTVAFTNASPLEHNFTIAQGSKVLGATPTFAGGTKSLTVALKPGTYTFYCSVPGHRQAGMEGTLTVS